MFLKQEIKCKYIHLSVNTSSTSSSPSKASKEVAETETPSFSIEDISLAMQFSVRRDNLSSISSTIPVKPTLRAECRADFAEPLPTVNAPICYVHLIRPRNDFASIDLLIRSPTKLFCMGEVGFKFIPKMAYSLNQIYN